MSEKYKECPYCGAVQNYKAKKCSECHKELNMDKIIKEEEQKKRIFNQKIKNIFVKFLIFFLVVNLMAFLVPIFDQCLGKPYAKAKTYVTIAKTINTLYIFPISKAFGYKNILVKPFYPIRDYFYNKGISLYPKNEGEREIQWFTVRYAEYNTLIHPLVQDFVTRQKKSKGMDKVLLAWQDELTAHLEPFAILKIKDSNLRKYRFNQFVNYALAAYWNREFVVGVIARRDPNCKYADPILRNPKEMRKLELPLLYYEKLKAYAKDNEKEGLNYFYNETNNAYIENVLKYEISGKMIEAQMVNNKLNCNNEYAKMYGNSFSDLLDYANTSSKAYKRLWGLGIMDGDNMGFVRFCSPKEPALLVRKKYLAKTFKNDFYTNVISDTGNLNNHFVIRNGKKLYY